MTKPVFYVKLPLQQPCIVPQVVLWFFNTVSSRITGMHTFARYG